ncbi:MAG: DUF3553 domain-containing protein, partial [Proteobacteria bacterium]
YREGDLIRHPFRPEWGIGRITVIFPNARRTVKIDFPGRHDRLIEMAMIHLPRVSSAGLDLEPVEEYLLFEPLFSISSCYFCRGKAMLVISRQGGFVSADCIQCGKANTVKVEDLPPFPCPQCRSLTTPCRKEKNYAYQCEFCTFERCQFKLPKTLHNSYAAVDDTQAKIESHRVPDDEDSKTLIIETEVVQEKMLWEVHKLIPAWSTFFDYDGLAIPPSLQESLARTKF